MLLLLSLAHAVTWAPCVAVDTAERAECATVTVPEDYAAVGEGISLVSITVARLPAASTPTRHLWVTSPSVGASALVELTRWDERGLPDDVEVYALEHRGVGSNRMACPEQEAASSPGGAAIEAEEIGACSVHLEPDLDALAFIDTTQSAGDLMEVSEQLKDPDTSVFFVGSGYGAFLLQRALVVSGRPEGVLLDGPWPDDASLTQLDADLDTVARRILAACDADDACIDRLGEGSERWIEDFLATGGGCDGAGRQTLATLAGGPPELQGLLPAVLMRSVRCKGDDVDALQHLSDALASWEDHPGTSAAAALHLSYAELWRGDAPDADGFLATSGRAAALEAGLADWTLPFTPLTPRYPEHDRPVLLLHPEVAPLTRRDVGAHYGWEEHHQLDVPGAFGPVTDTECGLDLLTAFLDDPTTSPPGCDASLDFVGSEGIDQAWLGTADRWGRGGCGCSQGPPTRSWWSLLSRR